MTRNGTTRSPAWGRLLLSAAFLAALLVASPAHAHSTVGAEAACAACTFQHQTPSLDLGPAPLEYCGGPEADAPSAAPSVLPAGFGNPGRSRAPPLSS